MSCPAHESGRPPLIRGLLRPSAYPHPAEPLGLAETHISWVIRAGDFAYKIKKPVTFDFLDFSRLERRRHFCEEEVRLNRRTAPSLYLNVVPITGTRVAPCIDGDGPALEYAVRMRSFDGAQILSRMLAVDAPSGSCIDRLAETVAAFHQTIPRVDPASPHGLPEALQRAAASNFMSLGRLPLAAVDRDSLNRLEAWSRLEFDRLAPLLDRRRSDGYVRECHGDLHLGNIVMLDGQPTLFDCIEFDPAFRWIDVMDEAAFLTMDLAARGGGPLAWRFLNRYLEITGDYESVVLLDYFLVFRAMVRAKIAFLQRQNSSETPPEVRLYLDYALSRLPPRPRRLLITEGLSGSGKSRLAGLIAERLPAIRLRSDTERRRLAILENAPPSDRYGSDLTARVYRHLAELAGVLLGAGHSVIVDATFLRHSFRASQAMVADRHGTDFLILACDAPIEILRERIRHRAEGGSDPSEADAAVLELQQRQREPLDEFERNHALGVRPGAGGSGASVVNAPATALAKELMLLLSDS